MITQILKYLITKIYKHLTLQTLHIYIHIILSSLYKIAHINYYNLISSPAANKL
jgi:hypothetical protein